MLKKSYLLSSIALAALPTAAFAQESPQVDDAAAANEEIIVTGTAGGGVNRQDAAFAITSINSDAIERAALRIAAYELQYRPDVPYRVVIDEALKTVKRFGSEHGHTYVNGVLDHAAAEWRAVEVQAGRG